MLRYGWLVKAMVEMRGEETGQIVCLCLELPNGKGASTRAAKRGGEMGADMQHSRSGMTGMAFYHNGKGPDSAGPLPKC